MNNLSQIQIAILVIGAVSLVGVIISLVRRASTFAGYEEYKPEMLKIAKSLRAELFRDSDDVVISGNHKKLPLQVRFSYSETTPGLNIRMQAPVSFTFFAVPKETTVSEGRVPVRTGDDSFDSRFSARTDHPTQARMLVGNKVMRAQMVQLCCSSKTYFTLTTGNIELSELIIPAPHTARHVLDHVEAMSTLAVAVEAIPGADKVKVLPYQREKSSPVVQIAIAIGAVAAMIAIFLMKPQSAEPDLSGVAAAMRTAEGVSAVDMAQIPSVTDWHAAKAEDFDANVASWIRGGGATAAGRVPLLIEPGDRPNDVAYWLINNKDAGGPQRVVVLQNGINIYDAQYPGLVGIARIPFADLANIDWSNKPPTEPTGDGLILLLRSGDSVTGRVFFFKAQRFYSGVPSRYEQVALQ